jgi:hypothetical protein
VSSQGKISQQQGMQHQRHKEGRSLGIRKGKEAGRLSSEVFQEECSSANTLILDCGPPEL